MATTKHRRGVLKTLAVMHQAESTGRFVVCGSSFERQEAWVIDVTDSEQAADDLLEHLWRCPPCKRNLVDLQADHVVIWRGINFYKARLMNGQNMSEVHFDYYLQEMTR